MPGGRDHAGHVLEDEEVGSMTDDHLDIDARQSPVLPLAAGILSAQGEVRTRRPSNESDVAHGPPSVGHHGRKGCSARVLEENLGAAEMVAVASRGRSYRRPCVEIPAQESWMILIHEIDREPRMFEYEIEKAGAAEEEIGRESCRERVCQYEKISVVVVLLKKKQDK